MRWFGDRDAADVERTIREGGFVRPAFVAEHRQTRIEFDARRVASPNLDFGDNDGAVDRKRAAFGVRHEIRNPFVCMARDLEYRLRARRAMDDCMTRVAVDAEIERHRTRHRRSRRARDDDRNDDAIAATHRATEGDLAFDALMSR